LTRPGTGLSSERSRGDPRKPSIEALALAVALAAVVALAFADVLFAGRTLSAAAYVPGVLPSGPYQQRGAVARSRPLLDPEGAAWVDEPGPYLVRRALAAGRLPLWNEGEGLGAPLAANPNAAVWSPLSAPVNLWPSPVLQDLVWLARVWLLGCFTALFALELGLGWTGALAAATALMLSGQTILWIAHHPLNTDVFVPLALLGALRSLRGRRYGASLLAAAVAAGLLGGKPQSALIGGGFGVLVLAAATARDPLARGGRSSRVAAWGGLLGAALLGTAIAAIALLPFVETYAAASGLVRAGRSTQGASALPAAGLAGLAAPWTSALLARALGGTTTEGAWLAPSLPYAGWTTLVLAAVGAWTQRRRPLVWILAATIAFYLLKVHAGFFGALETIPWVRSISFVKYCFPLYLGLALLAGAGVAAAHGRIARLSLLALLAAELAWLVPRPHAERVDPFAPAPYVRALERLAAKPGEGASRIAGPFDLLPPLVSNAVGFADLRAIDVLTPAATWNFVTRLVSPSRGLTWILADLDPLLVATAPAADLADVRWILAREPLDAARLPEAVRSHVSARRITRLFDTLESYSIGTSWLWAGVDALGGDQRFHWTCTTPCRLTLHFGALPEQLAAGFAAPSVATFDVRLTARASGRAKAEVERRIVSSEASRRWEDLWLSLGGIAGERGEVVIDVTSGAATTVWLGGLGPSPGPLAERRAFVRELAARRRELGRVVLRYADETAHVYENTDALGPAWVATRVARLADAERSWRWLATTDTKVAIALGEPSDEIPWPTRSSGTARVERGAAQDLEVAVDTPEGGVLVVPQLASAGWRASVDGRSSATVPVDGALLGVILPPGARNVKLSYAPPTFWLGAALSGAALLLWIGLFRRERG
jgi:hypothetical protein